MKPTPEQVAADRLLIAAVKAWVGASETQGPTTDQEVLLIRAARGADRENQLDRFTAEILLAALEAAEQDSARLDWLLFDFGGHMRHFHKRIAAGEPDQWRVVEYEYPDTLVREYPWAKSERDAIDAARKAQP